MKFKTLVFSTAVMVVFMTTAAFSQTRVNVRLRAGAGTATLAGTIRGEKYVDYVVSAGELTSLHVKLTRRSGEFPYFNVITNDNAEAIAVDAREVTEWRGKLPSAGKYVIRVYLAKAARLAKRSASFRIKIETYQAVTESNDSPVGKTVYYVCEPNAELRADFTTPPQPEVRIRFGTQDLTLPLVPSGSGSKYERSGTTFWIKGKEAILESNVLNSTCKEK